MNQYFFRATLLFVLVSVVGIMQIRAQSFDGVVQAFKSGDASALAAGFGATVELTVKNTGNSYSKNQAEMILRNFFLTNSPKSFTTVHQGTSPEGSKYIIGNLVTNSGAFRAYVYAKPVAGKLQTLEIRLEAQ